MRKQNEKHTSIHFPGGAIGDRHPNKIELLLSLQLGLMAGSTIMVPFLSSLIMDGIAFVLMGLAHGAISASKSNTDF